MATNTISARWPVADWRENFKVTRTGIFSIVFILLGIVMLSNLPNSIPVGAKTTLTWGNPNLANLVLLTREYGIIVAVLYLVSGVIGLTPLPERLNWIK